MEQPKWYDSDLVDITLVMLIILSIISIVIGVFLNSLIFAGFWVIVFGIGLMVAFGISLLKNHSENPGKTDYGMIFGHIIMFTLPVSLIVLGVLISLGYLR